MTKHLRVFYFFVAVVGMGLLSLPALAQIGPGVQQAAGRTATVTGIVTSANGTPVSGAAVHLAGPAILDTKSDEHGTFLFTGVAYGNYQITVTSSLGTTTQTNINVKGDINVTVQYVAQTGGPKEIAHVSTHSAGVNINVTAASVASIAPSAYAFEGNTTWRQMLEQIPGVAVNGGSYGGIQASGIVGSPLNGAVVSINGALPYETSTTLDGMPFSLTTVGNAFSSGGAADLSTISMGAFDAADIVRGPGANAPSILDSIGGSFVLHAPGQISSDHYQISLSNDAWGGVTGNALLALRLGNKLSIQLTYNAYNTPGPEGKASPTLVGGISPPATIGGQTFYGCGSPYGCYYINAPLYGYTSPYPIVPAQCNPAKYQDCYAYTVGLYYCCPTISSAMSTHGFSGALDYKITPKINAQLFYNGSRFVDQGGNYDGYLYAMNFQPFGPGYSGSLQPGDQQWNLNGEVNEPITQTTSMIEERITGYFGKGIVRVSALQGASWNDIEENGVANGTYRFFGTGYTCAAMNASCYNVYNGQPLAATFGSETINELYWSQNRDYLGSYETQIGTKMSLGASFVSSYLNSPFLISNYNYEGLNYCPILPGLCAGRDDSVAEGTREYRFSGHYDVSEKFSVDASYYWAGSDYHVYSCAGGFDGEYELASCHQYVDYRFPYRAPRFGATWRASPNVVIRGALGGGFALPQLTYLGAGGSGLPTCADGYCTLSIQNLNLRPETSFGFDLGSDIRLHHNSLISMDVYQTNLWGQFYQSIFLDGTYQGLPLEVIQTSNLFATRYQGINFSFNHDPGPHGVFESFGLGLSRSYVLSVPKGFYNGLPTQECTNATLATACQNQYIIPGQNFSGIGSSNGPQPYANGSATIGYRWTPQTYVSFTPTYYGPNNDYYVPAFVEFNAAASVGVNKNVTVLMTFRNIFNIYGGSYIVLYQSAGELGAASEVGPPYYSYPNPWGPRTAILTINFKH